MRQKKLFKKIVSLSASSAMLLNLLPLNANILKVNAADPAIENAIEWAIGIAKDDSHGYSQKNRQGPDYDCSSLVINSLKHAGINTGGASYTGDMKSELTKHGFKWIPWSQIGNVSNLQRGDILLFRASDHGHTEIYLGNGQNVGAHGTFNHPEKGDQTGKEISVAAYWYDNWNGVLRYGSGTDGGGGGGVITKKEGCFNPCASSYASIVEALNSIGEDSSFSYRKEIAAANGISGYSGTADQNIQMLNMLKAGTLKRPTGESSVVIDPPPVIDYGEAYFPACSSSFGSIVDALASIGVDSSMANRKVIAAHNGISGYSGTADQNIDMLNRLKAGTLLNPNGSKAVSTDTSGKYYPACASSYGSIVDALTSIGVDSSMSNRKVIAAKNGISGYSGTADQNIQMLNMLKSGQLVRTDWSEPPAIVNYTVSLDANGGTSPIASMTIASNSSYNGLPVAAREGYSFAGWFTSADGGSQIIDGSALASSSDHTLYAHWNANIYKISFENNDGTGVTSSASIKYGSTYGELPKPERMGYTFAGWFTDCAEGTEVKSDSTFNYADNQTLYAHWTANTYKVSLYTESDKLLKTVDAVYDGVYGELPVPESGDGKFAGWFTADGTEVKSDTQVHTAGNLKLYAKWIEELKLDTDAITLKNGEQYTIKANQSGLTYMTNSLNIAVVSDKGVVTAVGEGMCVITVMNSDDERVLLYVTVTAATEELKLSTDSITLKNGEQFQVKANQSDLTYMSNNLDVIVVSDKGIVTAVGEGWGYITVMNSDEESALLRVTVTGAAEKPVALAGDVNGDGAVNLKDVVLMRRYIAGGWGVELDESIADVNKDGAVNLKDVVLLRRYIAGGWGVEL